MNTKRSIALSLLYITICGIFSFGLFNSVKAQTANGNYNPTVNTSPQTTTAVNANKPQTIVPVLLQPDAFPGLTNTGDLKTFLGPVFNFAIALAVVLALVMIIFGGIEYMTTDSWEKKNSGKERIVGAFIGLGLALVSWLLLYTINPTLVSFNGNTLLNPPAPVVNTSNTTTNVTGATNTSTTSTNTNSTSSTGDFSGQQCNNCVNVKDLGLTCKSGSNCQLNSTLAKELSVAFAGQNAQITEGYPPTVAHSGINNCHDNGTCADVNLIDRSTDISEVKPLYDSMVSAGLHPAYEVSDPSMCQQYTAAGVKCISSPLNTAPSFHVNM